jgi:hypothetical protein
MPSRILTPVYGKVGRCTNSTTPHPQSYLFKHSCSSLYVVPPKLFIYCRYRFNYCTCTYFGTESIFVINYKLDQCFYSLMSCFNTCLSGINLIPNYSDIVPVFCNELVLGVSLDDRTFSHPNISCKNILTVLNLLYVIVYYVIDSIFYTGVIVIRLAEVLFR